MHWCQCYCLFTSLISTCLPASAVLIKLLKLPSPPNHVASPKPSTHSLLTILNCSFTCQDPYIPFVDPVVLKNLNIAGGAYQIIEEQGQKSEHVCKLYIIWFSSTVSKLFIFGHVFMMLPSNETSPLWFRCLSDTHVRNQQHPIVVAELYTKIMNSKH